jgi:6-pyruvoyl tetrahydropterin synthase/QueD family protein
MHKITKKMYTETAHRLLGHPSLCCNIHGHSYKWLVTLASEQLTLNHMVEDFSDLKKAMTEAIGVFDHSIVLEQHEDNIALLGVLLSEKQRVVSLAVPPTAENFCELVATVLSEKYPNHIVTVRCYETASSFAEYAKS